MKRHVASRQKPVPNFAFISRPGPSLPVTPSFADGVNFTEVIGTTTSLKSCSCFEEGETVDRLGRASWAGPEVQRHELPITTKMNLRKTIRHSPDSPRVSSDVLHALLHRMTSQHKGFIPFRSEFWLPLRDDSPDLNRKLRADARVPYRSLCTHSGPRRAIYNDTSSVKNLAAVVMFITLQESTSIYIYWS